jgi:NTE family protein
MQVMGQQTAGGDPVYGLVCAGGGAHGAYQVGVLKYVHEHFCEGAASPFRVFAGTSAGSLNTAFGAARSFDALTSRLRLEELWLGFHVPEYHGSMVKGSIRALLSDLHKPRGEKKAAWSLLDPTPIRDVVKRGFVRDELDRAMREGTTLGLAVSATEIGSSRLVWFQEGPAAASWNTPGSIAIETRLDVSHIQASCSVPYAFPPVRIGDHFYLDGGVANRRPFTPALNMGATRILSIATDRPLPHDLPEYPPDFKPNIGSTARMLLDQMSHDAATDDAANIEMLNYFCERSPSHGHEHVMRHILQGRDVHLGAFRPTEILLFAPSRRIRDSHVFEHELFDDALKDEDTVLKFHRDFVRPLIDFGYEDARTRHVELAEFFDRERPQRPSRFAAMADQPGQSS